MSTLLDDETQNSHRKVRVKFLRFQCFTFVAGEDVIKHPRQLQIK